MCLHHGIHNERSERGNSEEITFSYSHKAREAKSLMPVLKNPNAPGQCGRPLTGVSTWHAPFLSTLQWMIQHSYPCPAFPTSPLQLVAALE